MNNMENQFTAEELRIIELVRSEGYYNFVKIPNKGICALREFMFTTGIIVGISEHLYYGRYCYSSQTEAKKELNSWNGEGDPSGNWLKYKGEGGERENLGCKECKINQQ
jgi:hypothetical protein